MATIVLVHGIAQEQLAAAVLESRWLPALAGGVANSLNQPLADRIWRGGVRGEIDVRMAYYGTPFIDPGGQGDADIDLDYEPLREDVDELAQQLARTWLEAAARSAPDPSDRQQAKNELAIINGAVSQPQGAKGKVGRPALKALAGLKWFGPFGMAIASRFVWRALTQVTSYLTDESTRTYAQEQVLTRIGPDTRLVIGHSLGSVVAYEALHRAYEAGLPPEQQLALMTLGSPLGIKNIVHAKLRPQPPRVPTSVNRWDNVSAEDDLVAVELKLKPHFPAADGGLTRPVDHPVDTGAQPHDVTHYLTKPTVGRIVAETLGSL